MHTHSRTDEGTDSGPEDVLVTTHPTITKQTNIYVTLPMDGTPKSFVPVSTMALIAGGAVTGVVVLGLALVIILLVALFVRQNKQKVHTTNNRDVTYPNPVFESKLAIQ